MDIDPADLLLFARIVELGCFSMAAERVNLPKSTVSRRRYWAAVQRWCVSNWVAPMVSVVRWPLAMS